jgi:hypothetical protein
LLVRSFVVPKTHDCQSCRERPATALQRHPPAFAASTQAPLPDSRLSITWVRPQAPENHSGPSSPSRIRRNLRSVGHVARRRSLQVGVMCSELPPGHSFRVWRFQRVEARSARLPPTSTVCCSVPSPMELTGKGFRPFRG